MSALGMDGSEEAQSPGGDPLNLPWDRFFSWLHCICVVGFDLELGQTVEVRGGSATSSITSIGTGPVLCDQCWGAFSLCTGVIFTPQHYINLHIIHWVNLHSKGYTVSRSDIKWFKQNQRQSYLIVILDEVRVVAPVRFLFWLFASHWNNRKWDGETVIKT